MIHLLSHLFQELQKDETFVYFTKYVFIAVITGGIGFNMETLDLMSKVLAVLLQLLSIISLSAAACLTLLKTYKILKNWKKFIADDKEDI